MKIHFISKNNYEKYNSTKMINDETATHKNMISKRVMKENDIVLGNVKIISSVSILISILYTI